MQLGLSKTLVQELIEYPEKEGEVLGTALIMNIISAMACLVGVYGFLAIANAGEKETILIGMLYSISLMFQATEILQYWFQAKLLSKYTSIASLIAYAAVALYKVYLLVTQKPVTWFAISNSIDYFLISILLVVIYRKMGTQKLAFSIELGKKMLNRSKYYIVSAMLVTIFQQTDRIMLKLMLNNAATGCYSAAIDCVGITSFVFVAIIDSMRPVILEEKKRESPLFEEWMMELYSIITLLALSQSIIMTVLAKPLILLLYGKDYLMATVPLQIAVWYSTFSYYGSVRNIWILAEEKQKHLWVINISGAIMNVVLNVILIPVSGASGAAVASLITQVFTNVGIGYIMKPIKYNNTLMVKGLNPMLAIKRLKSLIRTK